MQREDQVVPPSSLHGFFSSSQDVAVVVIFIGLKKENNRATSFRIYQTHSTSPSRDSIFLADAIAFSTEARSDFGLVQSEIIVNIYSF